MKKKKEKTINIFISKARQRSKQALTPTVKIFLCTDFYIAHYR